MTHDESALLPQFPELGFYYHYKHDSAGLVNNLAYVVVGGGYHTEDDCRPEDQYLVIYRPLYDAFVYRVGHGLLSDARPLGMFTGMVENDGVTKERFTKIIDPETILRLCSIREQMYGV